MKLIIKARDRRGILLKPMGVEGMSHTIDTPLAQGHSLPFGDGINPDAILKIEVTQEDDTIGTHTE